MTIASNLPGNEPGGQPTNPITMPPSPPGPGASGAGVSSVNGQVGAVTVGTSMANVPLGSNPHPNPTLAMVAGQSIDALCAIVGDSILTITPAAGAQVNLYVIQDFIGGNTLSITDGVTTQAIPGLALGSDAQTQINVACPDGTNLYVTVL